MSLTSRERVAGSVADASPNRALITTLHRYQLSHRGYFYEHLNLEHPSIITINIPSRFRLQDQIIPLLAEVFFVRFTSASADLCNPEDLEEERLSCVGALVAVKAAISALKMVSPPRRPPSSLSLIVTPPSDRQVHRRSKNAARHHLSREVDRSRSRRLHRLMPYPLVVLRPGSQHGRIRDRCYHGGNQRASTSAQGLRHPGGRTLLQARTSASHASQVDPRPQDPCCPLACRPQVPRPRLPIHPPPKSSTTGSLHPRRRWSPVLVQESYRHGRRWQLLPSLSSSLRTRPEQPRRGLGRVARLRARIVGRRSGRRGGRDGERGGSRRARAGVLTRRSATGCLVVRLSPAYERLDRPRPLRSIPQLVACRP